MKQCASIQKAKYQTMAEQQFEFSTDIFGNKKQHTIIFSKEKKLYSILNIKNSFFLLQTCVCPLV